MTDDERALLMTMARIMESEAKRMGPDSPVPIRLTLHLRNIIDRTERAEASRLETLEAYKRVQMFPEHLVGVIDSL